MSSAIDAYGFHSKRALVVGGASGIGAATAQLVGELGAEVVVADYAEVPFDCTKTIALDLRDDASIAAAVDAVPGPIDALFACAGISAGPGVLRVNFTGQRELIERSVDRGLLPPASAIAMIASGAGLGWQQHMAEVLELVDTPDLAAGDAWAAAHPDLDQYPFSKEVVIGYCWRRAMHFLTKGIRINALCPSSTDTPLAQRSFGWLEYGTDYREKVGIEVAQPREQAYALAFLCSAAASYVVGAALSVDGGVNAARVTGTFTPKPPSLCDHGLSRFADQKPAPPELGAWVVGVTEPEPEPDPDDVPWVGAFWVRGVAPLDPQAAAPRPRAATNAMGARPRMTLVLIGLILLDCSQGFTCGAAIGISATRRRGPDATAPAGGTPGTPRSSPAAPPPPRPDQRCKR